MTLSWRIVVAVPLSILIATNLKGTGMSEKVALVISASTIYLLAYWIPRKPQVGFLMYAAVTEYFIFGVVAAFWIVPPILNRRFSIFLSYELPVFTMLLSMYFWLRSLAGREKFSFVRWLFGAAFFATIISCVASFISKPE
jgi:hypothetical protein